MPGGHGIGPKIGRTNYYRKLADAADEGSRANDSSLVPGPWSLVGRPTQQPGTTNQGPGTIYARRLADAQLAGDEFVSPVPPTIGSRLRERIPALSQTIGIAGRMSTAIAHRRTGSTADLPLTAAHTECRCDGRGSPSRCSQARRPLVAFPATTSRRTEAAMRASHRMQTTPRPPSTRSPAKGLQESPCCLGSSPNAGWKVDDGFSFFVVAL